MTALGCDPDLSTTGSPFGAAARGGPRVRSGAVLLLLATGAVFLVTGDSVPGAVAVPAVVVGLFSALVLVRRGLRLAHRGGTVAAAAIARAAHRSQPVASATP